MKFELDEDIEEGWCYFYISTMEDGVMIPKSLFDSFIDSLF